MMLPSTPGGLEEIATLRGEVAALNTRIDCAIYAMMRASTDLSYALFLCLIVLIDR
jgi:hypothetical protein